MRTTWMATAAILLATVWLPAYAAAPVPRLLVVMDEREQMEALGQYLKDKAAIESTIVDQAGMPADWSSFGAVIGYIHGRLDERAETKFIEYARNGGRLIFLHHTISSGKAANRYLFEFLGIALTDPGKAREPSVPGGHYAWKDPVEQVIVNLRPDHFVTSNAISWPSRTSYTSSDAPSIEQEYPAMILRDTEVYVNHKFTDGRAKTVLLGFRWTDDRNGAAFTQDRTGWYKRAGRGWVFYFQPGHSTQEFRNPVVAQMILNAILWKPAED
jgi:Trehalose utilisation